MNSLLSLPGAKEGGGAAGRCPVWSQRRPQLGRFVLDSNTFPDGDLDWMSNMWSQVSQTPRRRVGPARLRHSFIHSFTATGAPTNDAFNCSGWKEPRLLVFFVIYGLVWVVSLAKGVLNLFLAVTHRLRKGLVDWFSKCLVLVSLLLRATGSVT